MRNFETKAMKAVIIQLPSHTVNALSLYATRANWSLRRFIAFCIAPYESQVRGNSSFFIWKIKLSWRDSELEVKQKKKHKPEQQIRFLHRKKEIT